jgi:hypothetical protein
MEFNGFPHSDELTLHFSLFPALHLQSKGHSCAGGNEVRLVIFPMKLSVTVSYVSVAG